MTRKIVSGSPHREVGVINPRWLLDHPVHHESHLERRFVMSALACPVITDIQHQPITVELDVDTEGRYTPDFRLDYKDGDWTYIEVKPEVFLDKHEARLKAAEQYFESRGEKLLVVTDKQIDKNELGKKAILLMRYARMQFNEKETRACLEEFERYTEKFVEFKELLASGLSDALIWNMVARHELRIPPGIEMGMETPVAINRQKENSHDQLCAWFGLATR
jgi:hypothetical protein